MRHFTKILFIIIFLVTGCANQENPREQSVWEVSPTFQSDGLQMRGIQNRVAIIDTPFEVGQKNENMLHFWGKLDEITGKLTVIAEHKDTRENIAVLQKIYIIPAAPIHGADNHIPFSITFPTPGLWKLNVYMGDRYFDHIILEAK